MPFRHELRGESAASVKQVEHAVAERLDLLGLGSDLGAPAARKFDCEAWIPSQGRYREVTSCSNTTAGPSVFRNQTAGIRLCSASLSQCCSLAHFDSSVTHSSLECRHSSLTCHSLMPSMAPTLFHSALSLSLLLCSVRNLALMHLHLRLRIKYYLRRSDS